MIEIVRKFRTVKELAGVTKKIPIYVFVIVFVSLHVDI